METKKMVVMILISIFTFILIIAILSLVTINLKQDNNYSFSRKVESYKLTSKEQDALTTLISNYDNYLMIYDGTKDIDDLSDLDKINFIDRLSKDTKDELGLDFSKGVSLSRVKEVLKKFFGDDITFSPVNSSCYLEDGDYLIYDDETKMYKANDDYHAHAAFSPFDVVNFYVSGTRKVDNDKLIYTITLKKAISFNSSNYYGTYSDMITNSNEIVDLYKEYGDYKEKDIPKLLEDYKDKFISYTYIFETKDSINNSYLKEFFVTTANNNI